MPEPSLALRPDARTRAPDRFTLAGCLWFALALTLMTLVGGRVFLACAVGDKFVDSPLAFDRDRWIEAAEPWWAEPDRIRMREDAVGRHLQAGTTREAVVAALGEPTAVRAIGDPIALRKEGDGFELWYELGPQDTDQVWLAVTFGADGKLTGTRRGTF
jgi:hypothetical protein